ncbi:MAG: aminotransferase class V-fold PLP-dependent enzyme [Planctomycetota bacterium]
MRRLYLDHAATSFPKPPAVHQAMARYAEDLGASPGRGAYDEAQQAGRLMHVCRERLTQLINGEDPTHIVFTLNCSDALNTAIKGIALHPTHRSPQISSVGPRDRNTALPHLITTALDHNSVLRPYNKLVADGLATQTVIPCDPHTGLVDPNDIQAAITPHTKLIAVIHGSNVTGTLQPLADIGRIARNHDIPFLVDAAQTLGHHPLDVQALNIDLLAAPGHKGLLGPLGTGFLYIKPGTEKRMTTFKEGGTGSKSESDHQPTFMPDRFEPGSHNAIGILGLSEGVKYILDQGIDTLWQHQQTLIKTMIDGLEGGWSGYTSSTDQTMPGFQYFGPKGVAHRCGVFSFRLEGFTPPELSQKLETDFGILSRSGIHCAPGAHQTIGTHQPSDAHPSPGTTRLSFGPYTTPQDVKYATDALAQLCHASTQEIAPLPATDDSRPF